MKLQAKSQKFSISFSAFGIVFTAAVFAMTLTATAFAGDAGKGRVKAGTCLGCHAVSSYTNVYPTYHVPKLAGQYPDYIVAALQAYKSGVRKHSTMQAQAATLSDEDIADIAAYFSSMDSAPPTEMGQKPEQPGVSQAVMQHVETCAACHNYDGNGNELTPMFPKIAGQHRDYIYHTLLRYKSGEREDPNAIMPAMVEPLSDNDMRALAKYFSRRDGLSTLKGARFLKRPKRQAYQ